MSGGRMARRDPPQLSAERRDAPRSRSAGVFRTIGSIPGLLWRLFRRAVILALGLGILAILAYRLFDPPTTPYMLSESRRLGGVTQEWVPMERIAPVMARSAVAAEDANFCLHWGFDLDAIRAAIEEGGQRGASTISQQVVKNVYLWHGRSWGRKALEAGITPVVEAAWPKRRILEVYLNVAEFDEGVFGVEAAARHHFGVTAAELSAVQAARLAAVLPSPRTRSASDPSGFVRRRAASIMDGAATIERDGRADCFTTRED
jgi:monofunctional biosynthetic peptidoglycan transglycosylase